MPHSMIRLRSAVEPYRSALFLFLIAAAFLVAAAVAFPQEHPVYFPTAFGVSVLVSETVEGVNLDVVSFPPNQYAVSAEVSTDAPVGPVQEVVGTVALSLP